MSPRVCIKRVEKHEGHVIIKDDRGRMGEDGETSTPGTNSALTTMPVPTEVMLLGTRDMAEKTQFPRRGPSQVLEELREQLQFPRENQQEERKRIGKTLPVPTSPHSETAGG